MARGKVVAKPGWVVAKPGSVVAKPGSVVAKPGWVVAKPGSVVARRGWVARGTVAAAAVWRARPEEEVGTRCSGGRDRTAAGTPTGSSSGAAGD
ncbi:MAG: hypothetical protein JOZ04_14040 [Acidimicrobiia bacterium]|nr:hypothetical protein [Acidimicrobiia bacterium]